MAGQAPARFKEVFCAAGQASFSSEKKSNPISNLNPHRRGDIKKKAGLMTGRTIWRFFEGSLNLAAGEDRFKMKHYVICHGAECGSKKAHWQ